MQGFRILILIFHARSPGPWLRADPRGAETKSLQEHLPAFRRTLEFILHKLVAPGSASTHLLVWVFVYTSLPFWASTALPGQFKMGVSKLEASLYVGLRCVSQFQVQKCFPLIHTKDALCGKIFWKESLHLNFSVCCGSTPSIRFPHHTLPGSHPLLDTVYRTQSERWDFLSPLKESLRRERGRQLVTLNLWGVSALLSPCGSQR